MILLAALAATPTHAGSWRGAGWYRVVQWVDAHGRVLEEYIDSRGPFPEKATCLKGIDTKDPDYVVFCEYYSSDPDASRNYLLAARVELRQ